MKQTVQALDYIMLVNKHQPSVTHGATESRLSIVPLIS
jgi:hypothetical protein